MAESYVKRMVQQSLKLRDEASKKARLDKRRWLNEMGWLWSYENGTTALCRAADLLWDHLTCSEITEMIETGRLICSGIRIDPVGTVYDNYGNPFCIRLVSFPGTFPAPDVILGHKLWLEVRPDVWLKVANHSVNSYDYM